MTSSRAISGVPQPTAKTTCVDAWLGSHYSSVRLSQDVEAVRVHLGAGIGAATRESLTGSGSRGRWFAVGDVILTRSAYTDSRALPSGFAKVDWCVLRAGSLVNVGRSHPLFGHSGGGEQVEFVSGPAPEQVTVSGNWSDRYGRA